MNNKITEKVDKNALIAKLDFHYQLWKDDFDNIYQPPLTEADLKDIWRRVNAFFYDYWSKNMKSSHPLEFFSTQQQ